MLVMPILSGKRIPNCTKISICKNSFLALTSYFESFWSIVQHPIFQVVTPSKLIRKGIIQALKFISILFGLETEHVPVEAARNFSYFLRNVVDKGYKRNDAFDPESVAYYIDEQTMLAMDQCTSWATLGFIRGIAASEAMCNLMASSTWINMLLKMIESRGSSQQDEGSSIDLSTQILSLRLLSTILPHSKLDLAVQDRLFKLVGHTALMCRIDGSHFGDQGLLQKVRKGRGTRVALTAPPSSTIVSELIHLLRVLHSNADWSGKLNDFICLKLSLIHEIVAEIPILQMQLVPEDREGRVYAIFVYLRHQKNSF